MFVSFQDAFGSSSCERNNFPPGLMKALNESLPKGARYYSFENGLIAAGPEEGEDFTLEGFSFRPTGEMKAILGENWTFDDVLRYGYNSQQPIPLVTDGSDSFTINGVDIPKDRLIMNTRHKLVPDETLFMMQPNPFPPPFNLEIGTQDKEYALSLPVKRVPHKSVDIERYESDPDSPFSICYELKAPSEEAEGLGVFNCSISVTPKKCSTLAEVVNMLALFNSFYEGTSTISGISIGEMKIKNRSMDMDENALDLFKKALSIETELGLKFKPSEILIDGSAIVTIHELYTSLVNKEPVKEPIKNASIVIEEKHVPILEKVFSKANDEFALCFAQRRRYVLFGKTIDIETLNGIFGLSFREFYEDGEGRTKLLLENDADKSEGFHSSLLFKSEQELKDYQSNLSEDELLKRLQEAKLFNDCLTDENHLSA